MLSKIRMYLAIASHLTYRNVSQPVSVCECDGKIYSYAHENNIVEIDFVEGRIQKVKVIDKDILNELKRNIEEHQIINWSTDLIENFARMSGLVEKIYHFKITNRTLYVVIKNKGDYEVRFTIGLKFSNDVRFKGSLANCKDYVS